MKPSLVLLMIVFLTLAVIACGGLQDTQEQSQSSTDNNSALSKVALEVTTITWTGCWPRVEASAKSIPGVIDVKFDNKRIQRVIVTYDPVQTTPDAIVEAIEKRGDRVTKVSKLWNQPPAWKCLKAEVSRIWPQSREWDGLKIKNRLPLIGQGGVGGLIGSVCCLLPAVAIAIGLTGGIAATLVSLGSFRLYGIIVGLAFIAIASWFSLRRSRACCTEEEYKRRQIVVPLTMVASFGVVYGLVMYLVLPLLYKIS